jgi:antirestriction protein ArdC
MTTARPASRDQTSLYATITQHIVTAIDAGQATGAWTMPWHTTTPLGPPRNVLSQTPYRGINTLLLWATAQQHGYASPFWGTFTQWRTLGV